MDFKERIIKKLMRLLEGGLHDDAELSDKMSITPKKTIKDKQGLKGNFHFKLWNPLTGEIFKELDVANTVTELGDAQVADAMSDRGVTLPTHMAIGTGAAGGASATTLTTEVSRVALTATAQGTAGNDNDVIWTATFGAGVPAGTNAITEAGVFNAGSNGVMTVIAGFGVITKDALMQLDVVWTLTCGAS
jgi:hypothetical protein